MNDKPGPVAPSAARASDFEGAWHIGASASLQAALDVPTCPPALRQALGTLTWQFRCEAPIRRALASPGVAAQVVAALLACGATVTVEGGRDAAELPLETLLEQGQGARALVLNVPLAGPFAALGELRWGEAHVARAPSDRPIVAAWAAVELDGDTVRQARLALTGVWAQPARLAQATRLLQGAALDEAHIQAVAGATEAEVTPKADYLGSVEYRRAMAGLLARRALTACLQPQEGRDE